MTAEPTYNKHLASLAAIFILGDAVIILPSSDSGNYPLSGFFAAAIGAALLYFAAFPLARRLIGRPLKSPVLRFFSLLLLTLAAVYALYSAGITFIRYADFVDKILLPETPKFLIAAVFILSAVYLATRRQEVILKLSLIAVFAAVVAVCLFFLLSAKDFKAENIFNYGFPNFSQLLKSSKPYFINVALPALLIPAYSALFTGKSRAGAPFLGLTTGLALTLLCLLESLLLFGAPLAERLSFPLAAAVSTVTVGSLFTRMDGIVYCLFFLPALIKTAVCMKLAFVALIKIFTERCKL